MPALSDKAINAESNTEMAMVIANCWYNLPTMPGINPTGTNTAANINAMAITGPVISLRPGPLLLWEKDFHYQYNAAQLPPPQ